MKLRIETTERPPFWFLGQPEVDVRSFSEALEGFTIQIQRLQQAVPGAGQKVQDHHDRDNQKVVIEATTHRAFADAIARMDFIASLAPIDPTALVHLWKGSIIIYEEGADGVFKEWTLPNAILSLAGVDPIGAVGLKLRYRVQAGGFGIARAGGIEVLRLVGAVGEQVPLTISITEVLAYLAAHWNGTGGGLVMNAVIDQLPNNLSSHRNPADPALFVVAEKFWTISGYGHVGDFSYPPDLAAMVADFVSEFPTADVTVSGDIITMRTVPLGNWADHNAVYFSAHAFITWGTWGSEATYHQSGSDGDLLAVTNETPNYITFDNS